MWLKLGFVERANDKLQSRLASKLIAFLVPVVALARRCDKNRNNMTAMSVFSFWCSFSFPVFWSVLGVSSVGRDRYWIRSRFFNIDRVASMFVFYWTKCETLKFSIKVYVKKVWKRMEFFLRKNIIDPIQNTFTCHSWLNSTVFKVSIGKNRI